VLLDGGFDSSVGVSEGRAQRSEGGWDMNF
jgi:hypothetical protein